MDNKVTKTNAEQIINKAAEDSGDTGMASLLVGASGKSKSYPVVRAR